jgi:hypothetical protein
MGAERGHGASPRWRAGWRDWDWYDQATALRIAAVDIWPDDPEDLVRGVVYLESLAEEVRAWGRPRTPSIPERLRVDPTLRRHVGKGGASADPHHEDRRLAGLLVTAVQRHGPWFVHEVTGVPEHTTRRWKSNGRSPGPVTLRNARTGMRPRGWTTARLTAALHECGVDPARFRQRCPDCATEGRETVVRRLGDRCSEHRAEHDRIRKAATRIQPLSRPCATEPLCPYGAR